MLSVMCFVTLLPLLTSTNLEPAPDASCTNLPEWMSFASAGVDITTFDPLATTPDWKRQIVTFTCAKKNTFNDEYTNIRYDQPDQLDSVLPNAGSVLAATQFHADTSVGWAESMGAYFTAGADALMAAFSSTESFHEAAAAQFNGSTTAGVAFSTFSSYKVQTVAPVPSVFDISEEATSTYNALFGDNFKFGLSTVALYNEFIKYFGTHFLTKLELGAFVVMEFFTDRVEEAAESKADFSANVDASFLGLVAAAGGGSVGANASQSFKEHTKISSLKTLGGYGQPTPATWGAWTKIRSKSPPC